jgi:uncharacterized protein YndB with AHSA1/START domain
MQKPSAIHSTFVLERNYQATPDRVFAAFADPAKKRCWFLGSGKHEVKYHELNFREGGTERSELVFGPGTPVAGLTCTSDTLYQNIVANRRIVFASTMNIAGNCISAALVTVELLPAEQGTDLILTHQAAFFEGADGPAMREDGWRKLLENLAAELSA